jgi:hypothetical protein
MTASGYTVEWRELLTPQWIAGCAFGVPVSWFVALFPLMPITAVGWVAELGSSFMVGLWAVGCAAAILWLQRRTRFVWVCMFAGTLVAVSLGAFIIATVYAMEMFLPHNFSYFGR